MPRKSANVAVAVLERAQARLAEPVDVPAALEKLGARGNTPLARRLAASAEATPERARAFENLCARLLTMAPGRPRTIQRAVMFYIPDGAYQLQVFAVDDAVDGTLVVCCEDVLQTALAGGVLTSAGGTQYRIGASRLGLMIEQFNGKTENPPPYINAMTGWNRRAMRIVLPADLQKEHLNTALLLCAMSAAMWKTAPVKA